MPDRKLVLHGAFEPILLMAHQLESGDGAAGVLASSFDIFPEAKATVGGLHLLRADRRSFFDYICGA
jgi:hypothetical protein